MDGSCLKNVSKRFVATGLIALAAIGCNTTEKTTSTQYDMYQTTPRSSQGGRALQVIEDFDLGVIDPLRWQVSDGRTVAVERSSDTGDAFALAFRPAGEAVSTPANIAMKRPIALNRPTRIQVQVDWRAQQKNRDLHAGVLLRATDVEAASPQTQWLQFEYIGLSRSGRGRFQITRHVNEDQQVIFDEGWPRLQRVGRPLEQHDLTICLDDKKLTVHENGKVLFSTNDHGLDADSIELSLFAASGEGWPVRTIYMDQIRVEQSTVEVEACEELSR